MVGNFGRTGCGRSTRTEPGLGRQIVLKPFATMLPQELNNRVDAMVLGAANYLPPDLFLRDKACANQASQMKGQGRCRQVETGLYFANVEPRRSGSNEKPINIQAGQIAQFGEAACSELSVHGS
jgi:hypothetical protein